MTRRHLAYQLAEGSNSRKRIPNRLENVRRWQTKSSSHGEAVAMQSGCPAIESENGQTRWLCCSARSGPREPRRPRSVECIARRLQDWSSRSKSVRLTVPFTGLPIEARRKAIGAFPAQIVEEAPRPAILGVLRWWPCDLVTRLHEQFGISASDDISRPQGPGFSHVSDGPSAHTER